MNLTIKERRWLPWFGSNGKLSLAWSCFVNRSSYESVEQIFEGIAATRIKLLQQWTNNHWEHLSSLSNVLINSKFENCDLSIQNKLKDAPDFF